MKFLENKWTSFVCSCLNGFFAIQCYSVSNWFMFVVCSTFAVLCGYSFWTQMGEE